MYICTYKYIDIYTYIPSKPENLKKQHFLGKRSFLGNSAKKRGPDLKQPFGEPFDELDGFSSFWECLI